MRDLRHGSPFPIKPGFENNGRQTRPRGAIGAARARRAGHIAAKVLPRDFAAGKLREIEMRTSLLALALLSLAACATTAPVGPPTLDVVAGQPAPVQARLYAACIVQSAQTQQFDREG